MLILGFDAYLYLQDLGAYPPSVHCDEILPAIFGQEIITKGTRNLIGVSWFSIPNTVFLPQGLSTLVFGKSIFSARLPSAIIATLSAAALFFLTKLLFNSRVALLTVILFSTSHWWIASARSGLINIQTILPEILAIYFVIKGLKRKKLIDFGPAGFFTGLGIYLYLNSRIVPFIILTIFAFSLFAGRKETRSFIVKSFFIWLVATFLTALPMINFYYQNPHAFLGRSDISYLFSSELSSTEHMKSVYGTDDRRTWLMANLKKAFDLSTNYSDSGLQYGYRGRVLETTTLVLFLVGLLIASIAALGGQREYFAILSWFWLTYVVMGVLVQNLSLQRLIGLLPVVYILSALTLEKALRTTEIIFQRNLAAIRILCAVILLIITVIATKNIKIYFLENQTNRLPIFTKNTETKIAEYLQKLSSHRSVIFVTKPHISTEWCLFPFLTPNIKPVSLYENDPVPDIAGPKSFIVWISYEKKLREIISRYPKGKLISGEVSNVRIYETEE